MRVGRTETSANSAATKKALAATSATTTRRRKPISRPVSIIVPRAAQACAAPHSKRLPCDESRVKRSRGQTKAVFRRGVPGEAPRGGLAPPTHRPGSEQSLLVVVAAEEAAERRARDAPGRCRAD